MAIRSGTDAATARAFREAARRERAARPRWPALLIGVGLAGTLDEVILHQLLGWHHLYDRGGLQAGLVSDGLFHLASTALLVVGVAAALAGTGRAVFGGGPAGEGRRLWGGVLVGLGGFNLFDATVNHKLLRLHQVRPDAADWLPYDLAFGGLAVATLLVGLLLLRAGPKR